MATSKSDVENEPSIGESPRRVGDMIESLGAGTFLVKDLILSGGIWVAAGAQLMIVSTLTQVISKEWQLHGWQRSSIVSAVFVGILFGNVSSGPFSDKVGRRLPILCCYAGVFLISAACAVAPDFWSLCLLRFFLGFSFGFGQPAQVTLATEITPAKWRMVSNCSAGLLFVVGELYGAMLVWLDDPALKTLAWRHLTFMGALPSFVFGLAAIMLLHESASWLVVHGDCSKAKEVLEAVKRWNRDEQSISTPRPPPVVGGDQVARCATVSQQAGVAFGSVLGFSTFVMCFSCFVLNFLYYGMFYSLPYVFEGQVDMGTSPAVSLMIGALWELPGYAVSVWCRGRRWSILAYLVLMTSCTLMFVVGGERQKIGGPFFSYMLQIGFAGMKCWVTMGFCLIYQYASEMYPTNARSAGAGICLGCGRLGSILAPFAFETMLSLSGTWSAFFYTMVMACAANAFLILLLPFETYGMTLKDHVGEMTEHDPLVPCGKRF